MEDQISGLRQDPVLVLFSKIQEEDSSSDAGQRCEEGQTQNQARSRTSQHLSICYYLFSNLW